MILSNRRFTFLLLITLLSPLIFSLLVAGCAGKQVEQIRTRFIPDSKKTLFIGTVYNITPVSELGGQLQDLLFKYYQTASDFTLSRDFASADVYLDIELNQFVENPVQDLQSGTRDKARYLLRANVGFRDIRTKEYFLKDRVIEASAIGPIRAPGNPVSESVLGPLFRKIVLNLESLTRNGTVLDNSQFGYEGLEGDTSYNPLDIKSFTSLETRRRDIRYKADSDWYQETNSLETNRSKAIQELDRSGKTKRTQ